MLDESNLKLFLSNFNSDQEHPPLNPDFFYRRKRDELLRLHLMIIDDQFNVLLDEETRELLLETTKAYAYKIRHELWCESIIFDVIQRQCDAIANAIPQSMMISRTRKPRIQYDDRDKLTVEEKLAATYFIVIDKPKKYANQYYQRHASAFIKLHQALVERQLDDALDEIAREKLHRVLVNYAFVVDVKSDFSLIDIQIEAVVNVIRSSDYFVNLTVPLHLEMFKLFALYKDSLDSAGKKILDGLKRPIMSLSNLMMLSQVDKTAYSALRMARETAKITYLYKAIHSRRSLMAEEILQRSRELLVKLPGDKPFEMALRNQDWVTCLGLDTSFALLPNGLNEKIKQIKNIYPDGITLNKALDIVNKYTANTAAFHVDNTISVSALVADDQKIQYWAEMLNSIVPKKRLGLSGSIIDILRIMPEHYRLDFFAINNETYLSPLILMGAYQTDFCKQIFDLLPVECHELFFKKILELHDFVLKMGDWILCCAIEYYFDLFANGQQEKLKQINSVYPNGLSEEQITEVLNVTDDFSLPDNMKALVALVGLVPALKRSEFCHVILNRGRFDYNHHQILFDRGGIKTIFELIPESDKLQFLHNELRTTSGNLLVFAAEKYPGIFKYFMLSLTDEQTSVLIDKVYNRTTYRMGNYRGESLLHILANEQDVEAFKLMLSIYPSQKHLFAVERMTIEQLTPSTVVCEAAKYSLPVLAFILQLYTSDQLFNLVTHKDKRLLEEVAKVNSEGLQAILSKLSQDHISSLKGKLQEIIILPWQIKDDAMDCYLYLSTFARKPHEFLHGLLSCLMSKKKYDAFHVLIKKFTSNQITGILSCSNLPNPEDSFRLTKTLLGALPENERKLYLSTLSTKYPLLLGWAQSRAAIKFTLSLIPKNQKQTAIMCWNKEDSFSKAIVISTELTQTILEYIPRELVYQMIINSHALTKTIDTKNAILFKILLSFVPENMRISFVKTTSAALLSHAASFSTEMTQAILETIEPEQRLTAILEGDGVLKYAVQIPAMLKMILSMVSHIPENEIIKAFTYTTKNFSHFMKTVSNHAPAYWELMANSFSEKLVISILRLKHDENGLMAQALLRDFNDKHDVYLAKIHEFLLDLKKLGRVLYYSSDLKMMALLLRDDTFDEMKQTLLTSDQFSNANGYFKEVVMDLRNKYAASAPLINGRLSFA